MPNAASLNPSYGDFSVVVVVRGTNLPTFAHIVSKDEGYGTNGFNVAVDPSAGKLRALIQDDSGVTTFADSLDLADGRPHLIQVVWNRDGEMTGYVDRLLVGALDISHMAEYDITNETPLVIAAHGTGVYPWPGAIAEVLFYKRALSQTDLDQIGDYLGRRYSPGDWDWDGLSDAYELAFGLNPHDWDTDGDGIPDGVDTNTAVPDDPGHTGLKVYTPLIP